LTYFKLVPTTEQARSYWHFTSLAGVSASDIVPGALNPAAVVDDVALHGLRACILKLAHRAPMQFLRLIWPDVVSKGSLVGSSDNNDVRVNVVIDLLQTWFTWWRVTIYRVTDTDNVLISPLVDVGWEFAGRKLRLSRSIRNGHRADGLSISVDVAAFKASECSLYFKWSCINVRITMDNGYRRMNELSEMRFPGRLSDLLAQSCIVS
jgi:hypothetical protein